ncbi:hypothetical protein [Cardiobacterium valvarum]|uniref:Uncharacterized protein n=1 Tax=Cardiobacterium valvarum F0432 TaxID=797473 RepID=G9ZFZ6_9GAMM|nr:hypothetical protein [Cardiobacterium valvarum]EHM53618.1 hypothetical protein HMPREF9080_01696 [Cardiobacterium valvarum F0432]
MLKALTTFAFTYALLSGLLLLPTPLALHAPWCYPPFAFAAAMLAAPQRLLPFTLITLPLVYLLNFARFIGETVWYLGVDTLRQMHDVMLPMMLAQLRDNLGARELAIIALNITLVLATIALGGKLAPARSR